MERDAAIDTFLTQISDKFDYDCDSLFLIAELRRAGPTVQPGNANDDQIVKIATHGSEPLPSASYDTLGSHHIEYRIVQKTGSEKVSIERTLYTFQLHVLPGNCGVCVNRWVQVLDDVQTWPKSMKENGLRFRAALARSYLYGLMLISTGNSFSGAEVLNRFETVFKGRGRGPVSLRVLDLRKYLI